MQISLTELRRTPGPALDRVRSGEEVIITEEGIPMGRIVPVGRPSRYAELVAAGVIRPPHAPGSAIEMRAFSVAQWGHPDATPASPAPTIPTDARHPKSAS